jgi:hypothetical protein
MVKMYSLWFIFMFRITLLLAERTDPEVNLNVVSGFIYSENTLRPLRVPHAHGEYAKYVL